MWQWILYEHEDGRYAAAPEGGACFAAGEPKWHRVGPVAVHAPGADAEDAPRFTRAQLIAAVEAERHACAIVVWMTLMEALEPDADDLGLAGWMREAEARIKRQGQHDHQEERDG